MKPSQARLRSVSANQLAKSVDPMPAMASAQNAVAASAKASGRRGSPARSVRHAQSASAPNSSAASACSQSSSAPI